MSAGDSQRGGSRPLKRTALHSPEREPEHTAIPDPIPLELVPSHHTHLTHTSRHAHFEAEPSSSTETDVEHEHEPATAPTSLVDIEHAPVDDDPRSWSSKKKTFVMALMTTAVLGPMISPSIYNPVLDEVQADLKASETQIGLSLSLYILFQGCIPVAWVTIGEIVGRKPVYLASFVIYTVGSLAGSRAPNMSVLIGMRILQAVGSSAVMSAGAGSLADMYEPRERGRKLGLFYGMPMLGPTLGPLIGGALGNAYGWRAALYFLAAFAGLMTVAFIFFPDTWRKERSRVYQKAMADALKRQLKAQAGARKRDEKRERKRLASGHATPTTLETGISSGVTTPPGGYDVEAQAPVTPKAPGTWGTLKRKYLGAGDELRPSFVDLNPVPPMISIWHSATNAVVLWASGLIFAVQYTTTYTASVTFARAPYNYNPLIIGVVLLSFGMGNVAGSLIGGRWSDYSLRRQTARSGTATPEMRLHATLPAMPLLLAAYLVYAWTADAKTSIAGPVVGLFFAGFSLLFIYSATLAYLVDSNPGRSAPAVACNSFMRGAIACVMSQVAMPIQNALGDGGLYTLFTGVLAISCGALILVAYKGRGWRASAHARSMKRKAARGESTSASVPMSGAVSGAVSRGAATPLGSAAEGTDKVAERAS